jgi:hypothetical protein
VSTRAASATSVPANKGRRHTLSGDDWTVRGLLAAYGGFFLIALVIPLYLMVARSFQDKAGNFIGIEIICSTSRRRLCRTLFPTVFLSLWSVR